MTGTRIPLLRTLLAAVLALSLAPSAHGTDLPFYPTGDHYLCLRARAASSDSVPEFAPRHGVTLVSRFTGFAPHALKKFEVKKPNALCKPIRTGASLHQPGIHLEAYATRPSKTKPRQERFVPQTMNVLSPFFSGALEIKSPTALMMPTAFWSGGVTVLHPFQCYDVALAPGTPKVTTQQLPAVDARPQIIQLDVKGPNRLCVPASRDGTTPEALGRQDGLVCHRARLTRTRPPQKLTALKLNTYNGFGEEMLRVTTIGEVCTRAVVGTGAPAPECPVPTPSATPTPTVAPTAADRLSLERITLTPPSIARLPGESKHFIATGHFPGGITQDLSQELTYASSNPAVAVAPNEPGDRNRIDLLTKGTTTISATDPLTGLSTTDTGDDATLIATGPLQSIVVSPNGAARQVCSSQHFQATGIYEDGVERNLTQNVVWSTTIPFVASATNPVGDRSRVDALSIGFTHIVATEPVSGVQSNCCPSLIVYGDLESILIKPASGSQFSFSPARAPADRRVEAVGRYAGGVVKRLQSGVVFNSSDPSIVTSLLADPGALRAVGSGTAQITATDLATGVTSPPLSLRSLAGLTRVEIPYGYVGNDNSPQRPVIDIGSTIFFSVIGYYGDGAAQIYEPVHYLSSDPTIAVAEQSMYGAWVRGLKGGVVTISAVDETTGIVSGPDDSIELMVRGPLERLSVEPVTRLRLVGHIENYNARAYYEGGHSELITGFVTFTSSDPSVADRYGYYPGYFKALAPGTTVISAFDSQSGKSSTDSGGDGTLTVLKPLERITVRPVGATRAPGRSYFYTAIGRDLDGQEINLTQDVVWSSNSPSVALAKNDPDVGRSRIDTVAAGTTVVSAREPLSGVTSSAFGGDAVLDVIAPIQRLLVSSLVTTFTAGQDWQLTTTAEDGAGGTANLTQEVTYASSDPSVVQATNEVDHRSRIHAVAPGSATLSATDPITGKKSTDTGDDIVITVTP